MKNYILKTILLTGIIITLFSFSGCVTEDESKWISVEGRATDTEGNPLANVFLKITKFSMRSSILLAEAVTNDKGEYEMKFFVNDNDDCPDFISTSQLMGYFYYSRSRNISCEEGVQVIDYVFKKR